MKTFFELRESIAVDEKMKVSYKDNASYSVVFRNKNGKVESEVRADSKQKAEKQAAIRNRKVKPSEGAWEVIKTAKESVDESLRKSIAQNSSKFPEGSKVRCNKSGRTGKVLTVGKDFVKVAVAGGKDVDYKPSELTPLKESLEEGGFAIYKNGKPMSIKGNPVTTTSKAAAQKAIDTMMKQDFNKKAKFTIVATDSRKAKASPPKSGSARSFPRTSGRSFANSQVAAWRYAERGE